MGIVRAEENLARAHRIVDELNKSRANRPGSVVVDLFKIFFRLPLAFRAALALVEPVEIQENHTTQMRGDELEVRVAIKDAAVNNT